MKSGRGARCRGHGPWERCTCSQVTRSRWLAATDQMEVEESRPTGAFGSPAGGR